MRSRKKPTIDDVAAHSGVARTTVSRVLNGGANVRPEVAERVRRACEELDYKVNAQARQLASGMSRQLTLVHESTFDAEPNSYYHSGLELGALRACTDNGLTLSTFALDPSAPDCLQRLMDLAKSGRTDGLLLTPPFSDDVALVAALKEFECPVVCIAGGDDVRALTGAIGIDDEAAGYALGKFLVGLGHRHFGYIDGPEGHVSAAQRLQGVKRAMAEASIPAEQLYALKGDFTFRSGIELSAKILAARPDVTALMCANDDMAAGAMLTAHSKGLAIPGDLSVTGFDDTPLSEIIWPPLTTAHQPIRQIGQRAVEMLVAALNGRGKGAVEAHFEAAPFRVVERASTGKPRNRKAKAV